MSKKFLAIAILLLIWSTINLIYSIVLVCQATKESNQNNNINFDFPDNMSRTQKRLFEKQLLVFKSKFSTFSNFQLNAIKQLIDSIIKGRC